MPDGEGPSYRGVTTDAIRVLCVARGDPLPQDLLDVARLRAAYTEAVGRARQGRHALRGARGRRRGAALQDARETWRVGLAARSSQSW
jgi:hypothetical protein